MLWESHLGGTKIQAPWIVPARTFQLQVPGVEAARRDSSRLWLSKHRYWLGISVYQSHFQQQWMMMVGKAFLVMEHMLFPISIAKQPNGLPSTQKAKNWQKTEWLHAVRMEQTCTTSGWYIRSIIRYLSSRKLLFIQHFMQQALTLTRIPKPLPKPQGGDLHSSSDPDWCRSRMCDKISHDISYTVSGL